MPPDTLPLIERAHAFRDRIALVDEAGRHAYARLLDASASVARGLLDGSPDLAEARVAFLVPPSFEHVAVQWGIWRAGGIAVPLALSHPPAELAYTIGDADARIVVTTPELRDRVDGIARAGDLRLITTDDLALGRSEGRASSSPARVELPAVDPGRRAMIVYTSGTTSRPKGVVTTHANIEAQIRCLVEAWEWTSDDRILLVLPLHHVHGIVNVLCCALWSGARCTLHPKFDADRAWEVIAGGDLTLFMAVPTVYAKLIAAWDEADADSRAAMSRGCRAMRLMVSGSAALPVRILDRWREISGHTLLERYGMTEIGMALSNPLHGERRPGFVGRPLPRVEVRRVDDRGQPVPPDVPGEIEVRGPSVFLEYWRRPDATRESFRDGWFRTGDVAVVDGGDYRILGRTSVDILKTGGYKISALEIEEVLREHPAIAECAVVGVADEEWGDRVCAAIVVRPGRKLEPAHLSDWARERLAPYKLPRDLHIVDELPRNAMGKVSKPEVRKLFAPADTPG